MDSITSSELIGLLSKIASGSSTNVGVLVVSIVLGLIIGLFGIKVVKFLSAIIGFGLGVGVGAVIGSVADISGFTYIILVFGCAILFAVLSFFIHRISMFVFTFAVFFTTIIVVVGSSKSIVVIAAAAIGLILAVCAMIFLDPMIIVVTAIWGGLCAGDGIAQMANIANADTMGYVIGGGIAIVGMLIQYFLYRSALKRQNGGRRGRRGEEDLDEIAERDNLYDED